LLLLPAGSEQRTRALDATVLILVIGVFEAQEKTALLKRPQHSSQSRRRRN
jgi:hypothetical protein